jgi:hypothetical protein
MTDSIQLTRPQRFTNANYVKPEASAKTDELGGANKETKINKETSEIPPQTENKTEPVTNPIAKTEPAVVGSKLDVTA